MIPAHAFTPHKGVYGSCVRSIRELLTEEAWAAVAAVELGLSSDSYYADMISELGDKTFVSNSDAHSLLKIGREYNIICMELPNFEELVKALHRQDGRGVMGNFGLDPKIGKYHRTYCEECNFTECGCKVDGRKVVMGVIDRIYQIRDLEIPTPPKHRPYYKHQIPLANLPGVGKKTLDRLLRVFTEMEVLHKVNRLELTGLVGEKTSELIILARQGKLELSAGGGGYYGKVKGRKGDK